ncbi:outer kinetochore KNL1 complex subunit KNL1 [Rhynchocyon petersi]
MDKVCSEANEENDNRERTSRRRHSSILKPPRSPLQDLRSGNEAVQESIPTRTRKSSRRVSFADTIKIFQAESHMKIFRKSEIAEKEAGENVLLTQNKNSEDNHSEITGMNTLLCAPIQIQMQQKEFSVTEHSHERKHENDQTIIYLDENQMDLTASHTVMIAKSVLDCSKDEKSTKIDTKSFLASLKLHTEESRVKKELSISTDQRNSSEKKINFNDFIKRLKMGKSNTSPFNESDKENCELSIHAKEVNNASSLHHLHTSPHEDETSSNRTRNFGRQDDGMNFTQCHTTNIQALIPVSTEACLKETKNNDITICGNDCMDFTVNHTVQILTSADNLSKIENQTQNINVDTTGYGNESPRKQENFKSRPNAAFQDSTLRAEDEVKITKSHMAAESHTVTQTCEQHVIESAHSSPTIRDDKTVFYSTYSDGMELTKCVSSMPEEKDLSKNDSNYYKIYSNSGATSLLTEKTFYPGDDSMDITRSHTVVIDNELFKQGETNVQTEAIPISGKGTLFQNHPAVAEDGKMKVNFSSVPHVSKERLQQGLGNLLSISLTDRKTKLFTDEDTDLTTCYIAHLGSQTPLASFNLALENTNKCHSSSKSLTSEWGGKKKKHSVPSPKSNVVFETTIGDKGKENISKTSLSLDKGFPQSVDYNQNIEKTQNRISNKDLDEEVALGMSKNIVSCEKTLFSATKPSFMSERQILLKNNTVVNSPNMVSVPGENSKLPESLRKSLGGPSLNCSYDKMAICSVEEQNMDLTKSDTVVIGFGPSETQELDKTNLEHIGSELTRVSRQIALKIEKCNQNLMGKTGVFMSNRTERQDKIIQKSGLLHEMQNVKIHSRKSVGGLKIDKTILFSEGDENDMDITKSYTVEIKRKPSLEEYDSHLMPLAGTSKTVSYTCGQDDMEITRSHTVPLECKNILPEEVPTRLLDKTVMFVDDVDDLEMTKAHTILIDYQTKERTVLPVRSNSELPEVNSPGIPKATATPDEESVFFPEDDESGHPVAKRSQLTLQVEGCNSEPVDRAHANMEVPTSLVWRNDTDTQKPGFLNEPHLGQSLRRKSLGHQNDKTIIFSASDKNDMDITQSCMMDINNKSALKGQKDSCLLPLKETSKTVLYTCEQDDMEITNSHTVPLECKNISPEEVPTRLLDKTATFVDDVDDLEMTKAHTILIDYQTKERTVLPVRSNSELPEVNSPGISKTTATPDEESVFFPEDGESGHPVAKRSQLTLQVEGCNSEPVDRAHANMEVPTSLVWRNDTDTQKPGFLNEPHLGQSLRRKSLGLQNDKTVIFSESDKNDMDITQSCMMDINNKSALKDQKDSCLLPVEETSKTVLYTCGQDDMEITRSHTIPLECKYILPDEINTKPIDKTVMFVDNHNDLEVTKSQAVFIDCQTMENICKEYPVFERTKETTLSVSFSKNDSCFHEVTKKGAQAKGNIILNTEQYHMIPSVPTNSLSGDQGEMKITKFYSTAIDKEAKEKVLDKACTVGKAKIENCHLNKIDRENVDFASNGKVAFGSSDSYCCLPNVMSCVDNMEENIMTLYDKDKEEASNCPKQSDLMPEDYLKCEELPVSTSHPLLSTEITQTNTKGCLDTIVPQLKDLEDLPKVPQNLLANQTWGEYKDLGEMNKLNSKRVSFKLPNDPVEAFPDNAEHSLKMTFVDDCVASQPYSSPLPLLPQEQYVVNKDQTMLSKAEYENLNTIKGNSFPPICEHEPTELKNGKEYTISCKKELKENMQTTKYSEESDFHNNSDLTLNSPRKPLDTVIASDAPSVSSIKPYLNDFSGKIENVFNFPVVHISPPPEQLPELANEAPNNMGIMHATDKHNIDMVSSNPEDDRIEENKNFHKGSEVTSESLTRVVKDKVRKCSLGIFVPRLPNKRNHSVTSMDDLEPIPANITDANHLETHPICNKDSGIGFIATKLNLSPSQYINEENLPVCPEINFSDSISIENEENTLIETDQKEIAPFENQAEETCTSQKRTWVQEDEDNIQNEKKIRRDELGLCDAAQDPQICSYHTEGDADKNANSMLMKSLNRTPSSCSSSLDSVKADGTSLDLTTHRNSQMESQFLRDAICEENLREKLKDGKITIREFFILLQVHILIQKPRQSNLPTKFTTNTPPTPEDLMLSQYVYRPKILVYKEDCEALQQKIEELKLSALNQDKLLIDVNKNLWEEMRHSSEEQLKNFGIYLNRIKSRFSKLTKVFTHQGKLALYSKLVQSAQNEREKLQIRMHEIDNILKKIDNCLIKVEIETRCLEDAEKDNLMEKWNSKMRAGEKELEQLKNKEEELQRYLLDLQVQKEQTLAQIDSVQKETKKMEDVVDQLSLSEWEIIEWSDDQAVFTFLYDTIELTLSFGEAIVGLPFLDKDHRKIANLNFQSVLDEDKAPPSSLLVHKLIFQYIEEQEYWKKKCTTQHQVPKMLQEISLVVSHCRLLGEEIEFLKRWGPNYNLMNIDINNTELTLLFSSSAAFAKFEITLSLSAHYPSILLPFCIQNHLGNIDQDEIAAILSNVPLEDNYLKNVVKRIHGNLLQDSRVHQQIIGP